MYDFEDSIELDYVEDNDIDYVVYNYESDIPNILVTKKFQNRKDEDFFIYKKFFFPELYKTTVSGKTEVWQIGLDLNQNKILINFGQIDGVIQENVIDIILNTSGRDYFEQGVLDIKNRYYEKIRKGYHIAGEKEMLREPMRAMQFSDKKKTLKYPVGVTMKLNGVRCLVRMYDGKIYYRSRGGVDWGHLSEFFDSSFRILYRFLPPNVEIDGELYSELPNIRLQDISGSIRADVNIDPEEIYKKKIKFYIFDINIDEPYENRHIRLYDSYLKYCKTIRAYYEKYKEKSNLDMLVLLNVYWLYSEEEILDLFRKSIENGFEGLMISRLFISDISTKGYEKSLYKSGRRDNILKLKEQYDEEGIIVGIFAPKTGNHAGCAIFEVIDPRGNKFRVVPKGMTLDERREIYKNKSLYIGKKLTYKYQELSSDGVPQQPIGLIIRDYEDVLDI